jgi:hypothetical protein
MTPNQLAGFKRIRTLSATCTGTIFFPFPLHCGGDHAEKLLLRAIQQEIRRHDFNYFVDKPPSIAEGGRGVVVPGCPACNKPINTMSQFLDHLADDVMRALIEKLSEAKGG